jgi:thymidylate synthase
MKQYNDLLQKILNEGIECKDRTGVGTISLIGQQMRFDLSKGFPAVTTKRLAWKSVVSELLWFIEGSTNERRLAEILHGDNVSDDKTTIWTGNYNKQAKDLGYSAGELGSVYGENFRKWPSYEILEAGSVESTPEGAMLYKDAVVRKKHVDQVQDLIHGLIHDPDSRRHIITLWNPSTMDKAALPACHAFSQYFVKNGKLSCHLYQRSCDVFLGVPFNIASYSLFTHMLAQVCGLEVGEFIWTGGDVHIYSNHVEQVKEQLLREPKELPELSIDKSVEDIEGFTMDSFKLLNYDPHPTIKAPMAV